MMRRHLESNPPGPNATRFSLIELLVLTSCSAITCTLISWGLVGLGISFLLTIISFRTSVVDFTSIGGISVLLTIIFGTITIAQLVLWSAGF